MAAAGTVITPASIPVRGGSDRAMALELEDGTVYQGYNFGAEKSVSGELVFQTGMVGYPESITDPSYRGQILVVTFPLVGNYGVPSREEMDEVLQSLPKYFESNEIHVAALVVATYAGEDYSHFLAKSSLGQWLKEQGVPAIHGVDTRALTKRIRQKGSMLGRLLLQKSGDAEALTDVENWKSHFEETEWVDPNSTNLVAEGESSNKTLAGVNQAKEDQLSLIRSYSFHPRAPSLHSPGRCCSEAPLRPHRPRPVLGCWYEVQPAALFALPRR